MNNISYTKYLADEEEVTLPDLSEYFNNIVKSNRNIKEKLRIERAKKNKEVLKEYNITPNKKKKPDTGGSSTLQY